MESEGDDVPGGTRLARAPGVEVVPGSGFREAKRGGQLQDLFGESLLVMLEVPTRYGMPRSIFSH